MGRGEDILGVHARPDRIERPQPVEQVGILRSRDGARQGLVEVVVRVDQPRQDDVTAEVEHFISRLGQLTRCADLLDKAIPNKKTTIGNFPLMVIHDDNVGMCDEKACHDVAKV